MSDGLGLAEMRVGHACDPLDHHLRYEMWIKESAGAVRLNRLRPRTGCAIEWHRRQETREHFDAKEQAMIRDPRRALLILAIAAAALIVVRASAETHPSESAH